MVTKNGLFSNLIPLNINDYIACTAGTISTANGIPFIYQNSRRKTELGNLGIRDTPRIPDGIILNQGY